MLTATFQRLLPRVGPDAEASLWSSGVLSWEDYEDRAARQKSLFSDRLTDGHLFANSRRALQKEDAAYFAACLHRREHYRIPLAFPMRTLFLDIETTGLSRYYDVITLVGWSYRGKYDVHIRGDDEGALRAVLADAQAVVTFNGSLFDLPFLRLGFRDLKLPPVHIDLRFLGRRVALSGPQKSIEEALGFHRPRHLADMRGESAPILWHRYRRGDLDAMRLLIEYNHCDIEGMKFLFDHAVGKLLSRHKVPKRIRAQVPRFAVPSEIAWEQACRRRSRATRRGITILPYRGPSGPAITLPSLNPPAPGNAFRAVGIDLTGSEQRPSGWCLLDGSTARTRTLATDDEIVTATLDAKPHVVSIDSPLSLPRGRTCVSDDDPGREQYGIMRHCERALKRRGINVYPALIPSMQKLTARGIRLASRVRAVGIPVIESYPGAAQDIMGIPRKRASLEMLREGLAEFGVSGSFKTEPVTHDELDAITAAVVGVFFWSGKFEALGSDDEEALIIPDLKADARTWRARRVVAFSGPLAAGKTTSARYVELLGFSYGRYSMALEALMAEGERADRSSLQEFGDRVHREFGQRWLGRKVLQALPRSGNIVIDGLRFPDDHAFLAETFGPAFVHVHLQATDTVRKARFATREVDAARFDEAASHPVEQRIDELRPLAHLVLRNEGGLGELHSAIRQALESRPSEV